MKKLIEFLKTTLKHKIFQNFSYLVLGNVGMQALNLISVMIITKVYKPELFGLYSFITIQTILLASIADLGMRTITIRSAATDNEKLNNIFSINIISMLGANVVLIVLYYFYNLYYGELTIIQLFLVCLSSIANCYNTIVESVFLGKQKMLPVAIANVLNSTIWLLFVVLVFDSSISIDLFLLVSILIYVLKPIQLTIKLYNKYNVRFDTSNFTREFKVIFLQALPLWGLVLLSLPANFLANNFLSYNSGITEVGFFSLSQKFTSPISIVLTLMFTALFPNISLLWLNNKTDFKRIINKSIPLFILFGTFLVTVFLILIEPIFKLIFLEKYYPVLIILKFQIWYIFLFGVASLIGTILTAMHKERLLFQLALLNCVIMTPILWVGSKYNANGLSISYLLGFVVFFGIEWVVFSKKIGLPSKVTYIWIIPIFIFILFNLIDFYNL